MIIVLLVPDLTTKKCVSCNAKDMRPMTVEAAHSLIPQVLQDLILIFVVFPFR